MTAVMLDVRDRIAFVTFTRPEFANTINLQFGREFLSACTAIEASSDIRAAVLTGEGRHFCFGGDLQSMRTAGSDVHAYLTALTGDLHEGLLRLTRAKAPVIAAVNGTAAGAGLGIVLAADLAIAARSSKFIAAYTAVGLTPDAGCSFLLPRAVGCKRAMELFLNNRALGAEQALEWGLVNLVVDDDKVLAAATALAAQLAAGPVGAFGAVKRLLASSESGFEAQLAREGRCIAERASTAEGREGIAAFLGKRPPLFGEPG